MDTSLFIASRLRFKGKIAMVCIAVSFLVMIVAVAISSGFRYELHSSLSEISGDILLSTPDLNVMNESRPIDSSSPCMDYVESSELVERVVPVTWRAGIVRHDGNMHGVVLKGVPSHPEFTDSVSLGVSVPRKLASASGLKVGDRMLTYFIGEEMKVRQFNVIDIHDSMVETDDRYIVYASLSDIQRLNGWDESQVSAIEIYLAEGIDSEREINEATQEIGTIVNLYQEDGDMIATSSVSRYPQLFGWLSLIDFNVGFILLLMTIVAGFNMISGLLIMLFEHISTIGLLKSLGMTDKSIAKVFLSASAVLVGKGMAIGNGLAFVFCLIQKTTHILKLNPENYYVSFVPVKINLGMILTADILSFVVIMLLLLIPCIFISKVDPSQTVRVR
ncbi:MAG: ABC transporter permease [Bacteroidales bacterium]|nr:ABC transporter permease [Bacteroidales bacterium]